MGKLQALTIDGGGITTIVISVPIFSELLCDHSSGAVLAYVLAPDRDEAFVKLKALLEAFGITHFSLMGGELIHALSMLTFILLDLSGN